jgi:3-isopropylmalate/(R)-2-methylmalate dehydratase large subunit
VGNFKVDFHGQLQPGVTSKDMILGLISKIGIGGGTGHVIEYTGSAIRSLGMEARMTICNMSIEGGARAGLVAPDDTTYEYMSGREFAPKGKDWDRAMEKWLQLPSDPEAFYDKTVTIDASALEPMISFGTNPSMCAPIREAIPNPADLANPVERNQLEAALKYMGLVAGEPLIGQKVDVVFIGSCTNSRISDMREAANILKGRKVSEGVRVLIVPGSEQVRAEAESEGLDQIFQEAGAQWRQPGCSMCLAMNGDQLRPGERSVSTSNRNFEGRQGQGGRTMLGSPLTAAASAVAGKVADPREFISN